MQHACSMSILKWIGSDSLAPTASQRLMRHSLDFLSSNHGGSCQRSVVVAYKFLKSKWNFAQLSQVRVRLE